MKIYLYYDKKTKIYKGNEFSEKPEKHSDCDCLEMDFDEWKSFLDTNPEIIKIEAGELKSEKRIHSIEELKNEALNSRQAYLKQTFEDWFDDVENIPQEIKDKRALAKTQKAEIEAITNKEDLIIYNNF